MCIRVECAACLGNEVRIKAAALQRQMRERAQGGERWTDSSGWEGGDVHQRNICATRETVKEEKRNREEENVAGWRQEEEPEGRRRCKEQKMPGSEGLWLGGCSPMLSVPACLSSVASYLPSTLGSQFTLFLLLLSLSHPLCLASQSLISCSILVMYVWAAAPPVATRLHGTR